MAFGRFAQVWIHIVSKTTTVFSKMIKYYISQPLAISNIFVLIDAFSISPQNGFRVYSIGSAK